MLNQCFPHGSNVNNRSWSNLAPATKNPPTSPLVHIPPLLECLIWPPNSLTIKLLPTQHPKPFWILVLDYFFGNSGTTQQKCQEYLFMIRFSRRYDVHAYRRISDVIYKYQVTKWLFWCMKQLHQPKFLHHFDVAKMQDISVYNESMTSECRYIMVSMYIYIIIIIIIMIIIIIIYITPPSQVAHLHCNGCFLSITATTKA